MIHALITLIGYLLILGLILWLVQWVISQIPLPEPIGRIVWVAVVVVAAIVVILLLLQLIGATTGVDLPKIQ